MEGSLILLIRSLQIIWNSLANQWGWEMEANLLPPGCFAFCAKYVSKLEFRLLRHSPYVLCKFSIHLWSWWSCLALAGSAVQNFGWQWDLFPKHCDNVFHSRHVFWCVLAMSLLEPAEHHLCALTSGECNLVVLQRLTSAYGIEKFFFRVAHWAQMVTGWKYDQHSVLCSLVW